MPDQQDIKQLDQTIDYEKILHCIESHMKVPVDLLEEVASKIEKSVQQDFPEIQYLRLSIQKKYPILSSFVQASEVIIEKTYPSTS